MKGKVILVGAGPGDPELITVKGLRCLQQADVVLYDRLVNTELLQYAKKDAKLIYCGKLPTCHVMKQETINRLIVEYAKAGLQVVRLKGGDPYLFGRGGEEAEECVKHHVPYEVVPGITAGIAVPAYAGIPVTHRAVSRSVTFITGHQAGGEEAEHRWSHLAKGTDTICVYMGVSQLSTIAENLIRHGKSPQTPAALIHLGTLENQSIITGTLSTIAEQGKNAEISNTSIVVIGEVVRLHDALYSQPVEDWAQRKVVHG